MPAIVFAGSSTILTEEVGCLRFSFVFLSYTFRMAFVCFSSFNKTRRRYQEYITVVCRNAKFLWLWGWNIDTSRVKATEVTLQDLVPSSFWYGKNIGSFTAVIDREWYEMKWHINWSKRKCVSHCLIGCICSGATAFLNPHPTLHPPAPQVEAKGTVALQPLNTLKS